MFIQNLIKAIWLFLLVLSKARTSIEFLSQKVGLYWDYMRNMKLYIKWKPFNYIFYKNFIHIQPASLFPILNEHYIEKVYIVTKLHDLDSEFYWLVTQIHILHVSNLFDHWSHLFLIYVLFRSSCSSFHIMFVVSINYLLKCL